MEDKEIVKNADSYAIVEWRPKDKSTKTIVKTYEEAKKLWHDTMKEHTQTLAYAICGERHCCINDLDDFKMEVKYVKSKTR